MKQEKFTVPIDGHIIHFRKADNSPFWKVNLDRFGMGRRSTGKRDRSDAVRKVMDWFDKKKPKPVKKNETSLEDLKDKFLEYSKSQHTKYAWVRNRGALKLFCEFAQSSPVTQETIERYKKHRLEANKKPSAVNREITCIRSMYSWAVRQGRIDKNPCDQVKKLRETRGLPKFYSPEDVGKILNASPPHWRRVWLIFLNTGLRRGELASLRWSDWRGGNLYISQPKEGKEKVVPVSPQLKKVLEEMKLVSEYVLWFRDPRWITRAFKKVADKTNVGGSLHRLRHTVISHLLAQGVPIHVVARLVGHASLKTTSLYAHAVDEQLKDAVDNLKYAHLPAHGVSTET